VNERSPIEQISGWFTWIRLAAVPIAAAYIGYESDELSDRYETIAWVAWSLLTAQAVAIFVIRRRPADESRRRNVDAAAIVLDIATVFGFMVAFSHEPGQALRSLSFLVVVEASLRFGARGGIAVAAAFTPLFVVAELIRESEFGFETQLEAVIVRPALLLLVAAVVGRLTTDLRREEGLAQARAAEAERLRDELGRRVDLLEAANRCARALGSSLDLDQAFSAFIRELGGLVPFERTAIVLAENDEAHVMATAGKGAQELFAPGTARPAQGSVLEEVLQGRTIYREDLAESRYPEDVQLTELGIRSELIAPLLLGSRAIGMLAIGRETPNAFSPDEVELVSLLGRLVATGVQNIRAYEAERSTVEELRRLSALRADFVSLVSHELRSPMAAVIGAARTLEQRWRELSPEQRDSFLSLISDETSRLATLIGDVLDTSRIEAGTFTYVFSSVDVAELVRETVATASVGQDEVQVSATVRGTLPAVRGDRERLKQVLVNLIDNAVKYSSNGDEVRVAAFGADGIVRVEVADTGPGISREHQQIIFEKFGRARSSGPGKPGTGLGLFIARSIVEAHGGTLDVRSQPGRGSIFTLALPAAAA
jgi:signal transduction histidine kinase